jgi:predicted nuclease of predicted toxin-antitoxin system
MTVLKLLADMNISPLTVQALQAQGWDIVRVSARLPADAPDTDILALARREDRVIVTQDLDFSTLIALGGYDHPSLITFRLDVPDPDRVTRQLLAILSQHTDTLRTGCVITADERRVRVRRLPIR